MKKHFSNTPLCSWLKVFASAIILQIMNGVADGHSLFSWDMPMFQKLLTAGIVALLPVIYNYLNPNDPRYGSNKNNTIAGEINPPPNKERPDKP